MTEAMLNVVAKDPQVEHIAKDVTEATVHKHVRQQGQVNNRRPRRFGNQMVLASRISNDLWFDQILARHDLLRNDTPAVSNRFVRKLKRENNDIDRQQKPSRASRASQWLIV